MSNSLEYYISKFSRLRRDRKKGGAPHKPVLLLAVIDLFEKGLLKNGYIDLSPELIRSFKTIWSKVVSSPHDPNFALPFYHMKSEPFWELLPTPGNEGWVFSGNQIKSISRLTLAVRGASIDGDLSEYLSSKKPREILKSIIQSEYFNSNLKDFHVDYSFKDIQFHLFEESSESYKKSLLKIKESSKELFEEEVFLRGSIFKREIPKIYNFSCAISGIKISSLTNVSMVDACHIVPFAESYDDTIRNGIALSPNLHRAFDRGLISIDENYKVLVSKNFTENFKSPYNLSQFRGKLINLPKDEKLYPSLENLNKHRQRFGFG